MSHSNESKKLWNERFGHLKYIYIQALRKENMVEGLLGCNIANLISYQNINSNIILIKILNENLQLISQLFKLGK